MLLLFWLQSTTPRPSTPPRVRLQCLPACDRPSLTLVPRCTDVDHRGGRQARGRRDGRGSRLGAEEQSAEPRGGQRQGRGVGSGLDPFPPSSLSLKTVAIAPVVTMSNFLSLPVDATTAQSRPPQGRESERLSSLSRPRRKARSRVMERPGERAGEGLGARWVDLSSLHEPVSLSCFLPVSPACGRDGRVLEMPSEPAAT